MFMDRSKYEDQAAPQSSQFYKNDNSPVTSSYSSQFHQYEVESVDVPRHVCPVCDKTFRASSLLDIHMRVHVGAKPFVCPVCNHRATQKGNLKLHMKKHHGQDLPSHIDLTPDSGIWGNFSKADSSDETDLNFQLNCKKKTALAHSSLLNEDVVEIIKKCQNNIGQSTMGRITESLKDFLDIAKQKFKSGNLSAEVGLQKEEISHENVNSNNNRVKSGGSKVENHSPPPLIPIIPVTAENITWAVKPSAHETVATVNTSSKQFCYCKICGWKTTSTGYLNVHMRKHKAESHICTICGRAFKETWYLKNHMRSHVNDIVSDPGLGSAESNVAPENVPPESSLQEEEAMHNESNEKASYSMCNNCGLLFPKQSLRGHTKLCGKEQRLIKDCEVCMSSDPKNTFMEALQLRTEIHSYKHEEFRHLKNMDAMISNALVNSLESDGNVAVKSKPSYDPLHSLKKEIENSIAQNGMEATKKSFKELIKNPNFKILLSSDHLHSIAKLFDAEGDILKSANPTSHCMLMKGKLSQSSTSKPYKSPAMQSLANIGQSMDTDRPTGHAVDSSMAGQPIQGYKCDYCSKWFKYKSVLSIHMRSHTGERPYKCTYCDYAGTQHNCLKVHLQRHHPEIVEAENEDRLAKVKGFEMKEIFENEDIMLSQANKFSPARCPICDRVSPSPGYLKIHMRSHKTTLDHICHICGRGFKEYWYLSTHLRTHDEEINASSVVMEDPDCFEISPDLTTSSTHMQDPLCNARLTKQISVPFDKSNTSHMGHSYLSGTSSWSPLDRHEEFNGIEDLIQPKERTVKIEPVRPHVSKRKAFQPSRHRAEPYIQHEPVRSRKSKPRKLSHGSYLTPTFQALAHTSVDNTDQEEIGMGESFPKTAALASAEQPLDLTVPMATMANVEEPLNLAIK